MTVDRGNGPSKKTKRSGKPQAEVRLGGPERAAQRGALHEPSGARRFDQLVAERRIELTQRGHENRWISPIRPILERCFGLAKIDLRPGESVSSYLIRHVQDGRIFVGVEGEEPDLP